MYDVRYWAREEYIIKTWNLRNWYCEDFFRRPKKHWARENICVFRHPGIRITLNICHEKSFYTRDLLILKPPVQSSNDLKSWAKIWDWFIQQRNMCSYYLKYKIWKRLKKRQLFVLNVWKHQQPEIQSNVKPDYSRPKIVILSLLKRVRLLFVQVLKFGAGGDWNKNNPSLTLRVHMVKGVTSIFLIFLANIISVGHEKFVKVSKFLLSLRSNLRRRQI